jgi:hypothetical protein
VVRGVSRDDRSEFMCGAQPRALCMNSVARWLFPQPFSSNMAFFESRIAAKIGCSESGHHGLKFAEKPKFGLISIIKLTAINVCNCILASIE